MKAAVVHRYGPPEVVQLEEVGRPVPRADEVLVRIEAAAVTSGDARVRAARFPAGFGLLARPMLGIVRPRRPILGGTLSGVVDAVGDRVSGFAPGDEVCGMTGIRMGAHAEYVAMQAKRLARKPAGVSHDDAAGLLFGGTAALCFLRDRARVAPGMSVLVNGASGAIGTNAVQLARHFGATVTGVTSAPNKELVTGLGAARVIDYTTTDLSKITERFDVVFDTVGNMSIASGRRLLAPNGVLLLAVAGLGQTLRARGNVVAGPAPERVADFDFLLGLVAGGELTVVHDHAYALADIEQAYRRIDSGHKRGNIVVHP
ncbi:MAG: NAD(P)-dependent alcohol dehydrogenase [Ilumatobacteraceae bacterium]